MEIAIVIIIAAIIIVFLCIINRGTYQKARIQKELYQTQVENLKEELSREKERHCEQLNEQKAMWRETVENNRKNFENEKNSIEKNHLLTIQTLEKRSNELLEAQRKEFDVTIAKVSAQLTTVTDEMLKQRQNEFADVSRERIGQILEPLTTTIKEMRAAVTENTTRHSELGGQLDAGIKNLLTHTLSAQSSAENLARALRGNNRIQGEWGETVLRELLEAQGLKEGIHFETQTNITDIIGNTVKNHEGSKMRPDIILHLDKDRDLIIDSKVSLSAFLDYVNATTDESKEIALKKHIDSLQKHVDELAKKDYSRYINPNKTKLDYVIMFVPNTSALLLATSNKNDMWRKAMEKNVYIADEQTLYAALRIVSLTWTQIAQSRNHEQVYELAEEMLDRVSQFLKKYDEIGNKLNDASKAYEEGKKKLADTGHSIPQTCRKLRRLGAKSSKNGHPLLENTDDSN